jgi:hypothetical protein
VRGCALEEREREREREMPERERNRRRRLMRDTKQRKQRRAEDAGD